MNTQVMIFGVVVVTSLSTAVNNESEECSWECSSEASRSLGETRGLSPRGKVDSNKNTFLINIL